MFYENTKTGEFGISLYAVRRALPNMSIPDNYPEVGDYRLYTATPFPTIDWNQSVREIAPVDGKQQWEVYVVDADEIATRIATKESVVRSEREPMLSACDWTQLPDAPITAEKAAEWRTYRAELRAITEQPGFPWTVIWPIAPSAE